MVLEIERGSTRSDSVENLLWERLLNCRKTDYRMINDCSNNKTVQATYCNKYEYS
jgi:hypothetical protein